MFAECEDGGRTEHMNMAEMVGAERLERRQFPSIGKVV